MYKRQALHHQRGQVHDGGNRQGLRPVPEDVHVELPPEALHPDGENRRVEGRGRGRSQGAGRRAVRPVRHALGAGRHAGRLRRKDSRRQGPGTENLREAVRDEGRRSRQGQSQGDGKGRFCRRFRQIGKGDLVFRRKNPSSDFAGVMFAKSFF